MKDIHFVEIDTNTIKQYVISTYEELTGETLARAHPVRLFLETLAAIICWLMANVDYAARMNMLAYSEGYFLDLLGDLVGCTRIDEKAATTKFKITLSAVRPHAVIIPAGTRVATATNIMFATDNDVTILAGNTEATVHGTCLVNGTAGNDFASGEISKIIDHVAYVSTMVNITASEGGADIEDDESYRNRIREAPESFGSGTDGWYKNHVKEVSNFIGDVYVEGPEDREAEGKEIKPGVVVVYPLKTDGTIPGAELKQEIIDYLYDPKIHYLTDQLFVENPIVEEYDINLTYYIDLADSTQEAAIQEAVNKAVNAHVIWQKEKLGRDVNPSRLIHSIIVAGAKRVDVSAPSYKKIKKNMVATAKNINVVYGGLEDA